MIIKIRLFCIIFFLSCNKKIDTYIGTYKSSYTLFEKIKAGYIDNEGRAVKCSLVLNPDSSFYYETCGSILDGKWIVFDDSLRLYVIKNTRKKNDSTTYAIGNYYKAFSINGDKLIDKSITFHLNLNRDTIYSKSISILKKVE